MVGSQQQRLEDSLRVVQLDQGIEVAAVVRRALTRSTLSCDTAQERGRLHGSLSGTVSSVPSEYVDCTLAFQDLLFGHFFGVVR